MEELIQIAFSAMNNRLCECEKNLKETLTKLAILEENAKKLERRVDELSILTENSTQNFNDEVEEYKFGI